MSGRPGFATASSQTVSTVHDGAQREAHDGHATINTIDVWHIPTLIH